MRNIGTLFLIITFVLLCYFTFQSAEKVLRHDWQLPEPVATSDVPYRLVLITREMETPFWNLVGEGATKEAKKAGASIEIWGSYDSDQEDFLRKMDVALHSKVDGIIVQGLDTEEFKSMTKVKASFYGIPVITIANDVPIEESLRRTYVGSNHFEAGKMIALQMASDLNGEGTVVVMYNRSEEFFQQQRLDGLEVALQEYPRIEVVYSETETTREEIVSTTKETLNGNPYVDAFIAIDANITGTMIQEIERRFQLKRYNIYTFDDGPETLPLLREGKINGLLQQSPEMMGRKSVQLMTEWLNGETVPLDYHGYYTNIRTVKALDVE